MRYVCTHCGTTVESDGPPEKCPNCLRKHGLIPEEESRTRKKGRSGKGKADAEDRSGTWSRRYSLVLVALVLVAGAAGGLWWWHARSGSHGKVKPAVHALGPQADASLSAAMVRAGAPKLPLPFQVTGAVKEWAHSHIQGGDLQARAKSLQKALHGLLDGKTCKEPGTRVTETTLLTAGQILSHSGPARPCHSFALASLGLAAARPREAKAKLWQGLAGPEWERICPAVRSVVSVTRVPGSLQVLPSSSPWSAFWRLFALAWRSPPWMWLCAHSFTAPVTWKGKGNLGAPARTMAALRDASAWGPRACTAGFTFPWEPLRACHHQRPPAAPATRTKATRTRLYRRDQVPLRSSASALPFPDRPFFLVRDSSSGIRPCLRRQFGHFSGGPSLSTVVPQCVQT